MPAARRTPRLDGDAQIYARAATFNADVAAFFTKWMMTWKSPTRVWRLHPTTRPIRWHVSREKRRHRMADAGIICP